MPVRPPQMLDVLLVDDGDDDIFFATRALKQLDIGRLDVARSGLEALEVLRRLPSPVTRRLVLCDISMPDMDGLTFLKQVRADPALKSLPIVFLTGSAAHENQKTAYAMHAGGFVVKPQNPDGLLDILRTVIDYWRHGQLP